MVKEVATELEQSTLSKAVKNVKQKLLTKEKKPEIKEAAEITPPETKHVHFNRGVVYLGHIPHGFFEEQMRDYFKQFGKITRVRLARSKNTGRSRGYGYVEFVHKEVAKIAAESMNNYLMCGRLLKATYIPPEKQHDGFFIGRQWSKQNYPRLINREKQNTQKNKNVDNKVEACLVQRGLSKISNMQKKLAAIGIDYKIEPIEVPTPIVKKRKAAAELPSKEIKKRKNASENCEMIKTKKGTEVDEPVVEIVKKKDKGDEVSDKKMKNKIQMKGKSKTIKKENKVKIISDVLLAPNLKKNIFSDGSSIIGKKGSNEKAVKSLPKKTKKNVKAEENIDEKRLIEKVKTEVPIVRKLEKEKLANGVKSFGTLKQKKTPVAVPAVSGNLKKKKSPAVSPAIEKSKQKKISLGVPTVKKTKRKTGAQSALKNKENNKEKKSVAA